MHDFEAWDRYWNDQIDHDFGPPIFDLFCDDRLLVDVIHKNGMKTVLCVGSGISQEPRALAQAGLRVTALDFSPVALQLAQEFKFDSKALEFFIEEQQRQPEGRVDFIVGDLRDTKICPGPFDVIIERRTLQLFPEGERNVALAALTDRLTSEGIFLSHCHDNRWKPPGKPFHATEAWFRTNGWTIWRGESKPKPNGRIAWIFVSTG